MANQASKIKAARAEARKQIERNARKVKLETEPHGKREHLISEEVKAILKDMRKHGFCPHRAMPTVRQYSRYAAFKNSQSATARAKVIADDTALISARGGLVELIYERLENPKIKDTAFSQLTTLLQRQLALAPALVDETQRVSLASDSNVIDDDELGRIAKEFGVDL